MLRLKKKKELDKYANSVGQNSFEIKEYDKKCRFYFSVLHKVPMTKSFKLKIPDNF